MTSQERVERMFDRREQDSIPRFESFWGDTIENWQKHPGYTDPLALLGSDFDCVAWLEPAPFPGQDTLIAEDDETKTVRNHWGEVARYWKHRMGTPEHHGFPCPDPETWFDGGFRERFIQAPLNQTVESAVRAFTRARRNGKWSYIAGLETYEITRHIMGDEVTMMAMIEEPEWVADVSRVTTDATLRLISILIDAGCQVDGIWIYGDMAYRSGLLSGPPLYRELIWPDHKRMADFAHERGMRFIYHTDGDVNLVLDDYVKAGFDCLQPLEAKAGMNVVDMAPVYGSKMALFGNCDVMVYATNDKDLIEAEIEKKVKAGKETVGYAYHSDHSVPPSTNWESWEFICDTVERLGNYD